MSQAGKGCVVCWSRTRLCLSTGPAERYWSIGFIFSVCRQVWCSCITSQRLLKGSWGSRRGWEESERQDVSALVHERLLETLMVLVTLAPLWLPLLIARDGSEPHHHMQAPLRVWNISTFIRRIAVVMRLAVGLWRIKHRRHWNTLKRAWSETSCRFV